MTTPPLRVALVAPSRYPVREPYPGGLEAMVATLARELRARGHEVELYAVRGSEGGSPRFAFPGVDWTADDTGYPEGGVEAEHRAFAELARHLVEEGHHDVVHNHSLHPGLHTRAADLPAPLLTTLHTPPFWEMQDPIALAARTCTDCGAFTAVSSVVADAWRLPTRAQVIGNGVDPRAWPAGPGGNALVWTGRLVPEKAPHLALLAAREAGLPIRVAGRVGDADYVRTHVLPLLSPDREYVGELDHSGVARLVGESACALVTPAWEEPFGLVVAEALMCGTPVAAVARGGVPEVLGPWAARCSTSSAEPAALAAVIGEAVRVDRRALRADALERLGVGAMTDRYVERYRALVPTAATS